MRFPGKLCILVLYFLGSTFSSRAQVKTSRPNIVLINMDDMGYGDPTCYGGGPYQTPQIDALAASGVRFTEFYAAQAVCSASRSALLTGCYPTRIGISGALDHNAKFALNPNETTLPEMLKSVGYATGMVGKWHLGHKQPYLPLQNGFDEFFGLPYSNDMWAYDYNGERWKDTSFWRAKYPPLPLIDGNETVKIIDGFDDQDGLTSAYTQRAVSFIQSNHKKPFFLYFAHSMVHVPLGASAKFKGKSGAGLFGDVMEEVDWSVGEVIKVLKANKVYDNTIVIFTSDNGPWLTFGNHAGNTGGLREGKGTAWDGGLKVPCIISWPGHTKAGTVSNRLLTNMDLLPTLADICKAQLPQQKIDGVDFKAVLLGDQRAVPRDEFAYYYDRNNLKAIRKENWKLVFPATSQTYGPPATIGGDRYPGKYAQADIPMALYDLSTDPGEDRDVQAQYPEIVKQLSEIANRYRKALGDGLTNSVGTEIRPAAQLQ
ncbi:sulfatase family protein [Flavihumibacter petaseus]|uniref:Putative sulfatase n=1 Tax=Flavihumibacter petaseus NBRC 106054 TaxID=1220578 RepID=A0A0E9N124_9BACT|nr:sulfatase [Flavihumibacter petaseus]GAO43554.1 putative sulfatase [Flavihumibacter petaseus NBRC 106054]